MDKTMEDKISLKELIDRISILGDSKDFHKQVQNFTENAIAQTFVEGKMILNLEGRETMANAFSVFLKDFENVYHFNGQHLFTLDGDQATGTSYCLIILIGNENGKKIKKTIGAIYNDSYIRVEGQWLVDKRVGNFIWQESV